MGEHFFLRSLANAGLSELLPGLRAKTYDRPGMVAIDNARPSAHRVKACRSRLPEHVARMRAVVYERRVVTIGVYDWDLESFLGALAAADVGLLLDVRQRRGVRGAQYAWANSLRLQRALADAEIDYRHHPELAPTTELRHVQYAEDARVGVGKRSRTVLAPEYRRRYTHEILDRLDLGALAAQLPDERASALLCVEQDPAACHRSIIAERLARRHGFAVEHVLPS